MMTFLPPIPLVLAFSVLVLRPSPSHTASAAPGDQRECFVAMRLGTDASPSELIPPRIEEVPPASNECQARTAPASTFKIPHALIALETGVIGRGTVFEWDGSPRPFVSWQRDHTLDSAMKSSVYPFFQHTARMIGRERMQRALSALVYGSDSFEGELTTFWTNGDLVVSPREQLAFLQRLFTGKLLSSAGHVHTVQESLQMPAGKITNAAGVHDFPLAWPGLQALHAKTGNATVDGERISWLVGHLRARDEEYVFAARVRSKTQALATTAGAELARRGLNALRRTRPQSGPEANRRSIPSVALALPSCGVVASSSRLHPTRDIGSAVTSPTRPRMDVSRTGPRPSG